MKIGGQKKPTITAMRKRMTREQKLEAKKRLKEEKAKESGTFPYVIEEEDVSKLISSSNYVTPFILTSKLRIKLSKSREILRRLASEGKLELVEKNRELEVYKPLVA